MRIFFIPDHQAFLLDILVWAVLHLTIGFTCSRIPVGWFDPNNLIYRTHWWEKGGEVYQKVFRVRAWKAHIPSGGSLYPNTFSIQRVLSFDVPYLDRWLRETCRSEFTHWMMVIPGFLFFFWNSEIMARWMVVYAVANNLIPIVLQRFNRPRIRAILELRKKDRGPSQGLCPVIMDTRERAEEPSHSYG